MSLGGKTRIISVELGKAKGIAARKAVAGMSGEERWALFLCYSAEKGKRELVNEILEQEEAIAMAGETMLAFSKEQIEWFRNESKLKYELDMKEMALDARDEGHKQGLEEGREEGHRQGLEEGREEGHRQGRAEGRQEGITIGEARAAEKIHKENLRAALNLRHMGLSDEQIASALGLGAGDLKDLDSKKG